MKGEELLVAAGQALYGGRWQTPLARDLGTTYRSVRHWLSGQHAAPNDLPERLIVLLHRREIEIETVLDRIETARKES